MRVAILGAGSWGTALAIEFARSGHETMLWGRDPEVASRIEADGRHPRRLSGFVLPPTVRPSSDLSEAYAFGEIVFVSVPCASIRPLLDLSPAGDGAGLRIVSTSKGIEPDTLQRMTQVMHERYPAAALAALSGPTFAEGVARADPTAAVVASEHADYAGELQSCFSSSTFRLYRSDDVIGVELAGALKNVVAIAAGIVSGLGYGHNTLAALVTRGLVEITRLGLALGADADTFPGLAGMGDLMATCASPDSRNHTLGVHLGLGMSLDDAIAATGGTAEGVKSSRSVLELATTVGVEMPITAAVAAVLFDGLPVDQLAAILLARPHKPEGL